MVPQLRPFSEDGAYAVSQPGAIAPGNQTENTRTTAARSENAGQHFDRGGFSGSVRTDERNRLSRRDLQADAMNGYNLSSGAANSPPRLREKVLRKLSNSTAFI